MTRSADWTHAQRRKNAILYTVSRAAILGLGMLPAVWLRSVGRAAGRLAYLLFASARRTAHANVDRVLDQLDSRTRRALVRACYSRLGEHLGDSVALLCGASFVPIPFDDSARGVLKTARDEGRGVVFVSAHLGPWERVAGSLVAAGFPLTTVAREPYDPRFTALYDSLRTSLGVRSVYRGSPGAAMRIVRALRRGDLLGMPMDLRSRVPSVDVPFLGHTAPTAVGPARIALRAGASVVVGTVALSGDGGGLVLSAVRIPTHDLPRTAQGEIVLTTRMNAEISRRILALPDEWVWMHPRWT